MRSEMNARARGTDPETSHDAARSLGDLRPRQFAVLNVIRRSSPLGLTDEEMIEAYGEAVDSDWNPCEPQSESGLRTRRSELVRYGFVKDSGVRRLTRGGRQTIVWKAVPWGEVDAERQARAAETPREEPHESETDHGRAERYAETLISIQRRLEDLRAHITDPSVDNDSTEWTDGALYIISEIEKEYQ